MLVLGGYPPKIIHYFKKMWREYQACHQSLQWETVRNMTKTLACNDFVERKIDGVFPIFCSRKHSKGSGDVAQLGARVWSVARTAGSDLRDIRPCLHFSQIHLSEAQMRKGPHSSWIRFDRQHGSHLLLKLQWDEVYGSKGTKDPQHDFLSELLGRRHMVR